jgi:plasmid stabilization system protein ParE
VTKILFHELAGRELLDVRDYYDDLVFGLGEKFIIEVDRCLNVIKANPLAYPITKENIRKAVIIKFPYSILYRLEKNSIYILAVMHQKRKPRYWTERM